MLVLSTERKEFLARLVRIPLMSRVMRLGIQTIVPRHRVGVGIVGFNKQNQILLLRHVFHPVSPWGVPGGWLERHESPAEGALRELREETGLTAVLGPPLLVSREGPPSQLCISYLASIDRDPIRLSPEIIEWGWFDPGEMPGPLLPFARASIELAVSSIAVSSAEVSRVKFT